MTDVEFMEFLEEIEREIEQIAEEISEILAPQQSKYVTEKSYRLYTDTYAARYLIYADPKAHNAREPPVEVIMVKRNYHRKMAPDAPAP